MNKNNTCICCGESSLKKVYNGLLMRCSVCGHHVAHPRFFAADFHEVYSEEYFNGAEYLDYVNDRAAIQKNFDKRLKQIRKEVGNNMNSVLEIGAAYGFFGDSLKNYFPACQYTGFEISPEPASWARKQLQLDVRNEDYLSSDIPKSSIDAVFMWDVVEHLPDPEIFLKKIHEELVSGGRLYLTTGDIGRLLPALQGRRWRMIHPPTHLHYFSKKSMRQLLKKNGFNIIQVSYPAVYRSLRQIWYSLFFLKKRRQMTPAKNNLYIGINTFDIMFVVAEKK